MCLQVGCQHQNVEVPLSSAVYYMVKVIIRVYTVVEPSTTHHIHKVSCDRQIQYFRGWPIEEVGTGGDRVEFGCRWPSGIRQHGRTRRSAPTRNLYRIAELIEGDAVWLANHQMIRQHSEEYRFRKSATTGGRGSPPVHRDFGFESKRRMRGWTRQPAPTRNFLNRR